MKKILSLFILTTLSTIVLPQTYFSERYNLYYSDGLDFCHNIITNDTGYFLVGGTTLESQDFRLEVTLSFLNLSGELLFTKIIKDSIWSYDIGYSGSARFIDDKLFAVGVRRKPLDDFIRDEGVIYKFDSNLDTLWTRTIGDQQLPNDTNYQFRHFEILPDKKLIIAGNIVISGEKGIALLLKTDSLGNELWRQYYPRWPHSKGINVIQTPDGGFAFSVYNWIFQSDFSENFLFKTDSLGNEQWRRMIGGPYSDGPMYLVSSPDSTIVGAYSYSDSVASPSTDSFNREAIVKYDLEGNLIWEKIYGESLLNKWVKSADITDDGKLILSGITFRDGGDYHYYRVGYLLNCNNDGDSLWYREYELFKQEPSGNYFEGVSPTIDGGYITVGYVLPFPPDTGNQDVWVIKVDSLGCESWDICWVGEKEHIALREAGQLKIFPNPANFVVNIFVPKENEEETHLLLIYDLYGRKVEETEVPPGVTTIHFNVSGWRSGLYTAIANYKGKISGRGKFVVR